MRSRLEFTAATKRAAFARSTGVCECHLIPWLRRPAGCGVKLVAGGMFFEHITPDAIRPDNSIDNIACLTRTCWREKTARFDLPVIAKSNRVRDRHFGTRAEPQQVIVGSKASGWKHRMAGGWIRRRNA
jgi:hypothetical protein